MLIDVCLFDVNEIKYNQDSHRYCFPVYDIHTGLLWYTATCTEDMYRTQFASVDPRPYHLYFCANLKDVPMLVDFVGPVPEARQQLDLMDCTVLPSEPLIPQGFVNQARPTILPYKFEPGSKEGYYMIKMTGQVRYVPATRDQQELEEDLDIDFDLDLGEDDYTEVKQPTLSVFDTDQATAPGPSHTSVAGASHTSMAGPSRQAPQHQFSSSTAPSKGITSAISAIQQQVAKKKGISTKPSTLTFTSKPSKGTSTKPSTSTSKYKPSTSSSTSTSTSKPSASGTTKSKTRTSQTLLAMTAKRFGKQPAVAAQRTTSSVSSLDSSASEPDYMGLYQMEQQLAESSAKSTLSAAVATSGFAAVAATGKMDTGDNDDDGGIDTDEEEMPVLHSALKRSRTRDTQSTASSTIQDKKKSKTDVIQLLEAIQKKSKKSSE